MSFTDAGTFGAGASGWRHNFGEQGELRKAFIVMKVLVADDDPISSKIVESNVRRWGFTVDTVKDGLAALDQLRTDESIRIAILDWMMPGLDGPEVCRRIREICGERPLHLILLTAKSEKDDRIAGLRSGADDYLTKPFDRDELFARLKVGVRIVQLQVSLGEQVHHLSEALRRVKQLQGLLPICCYCKHIRDDANYWHTVEDYITRHSDVHFSHGICPRCYQSVVEPQLAAARSSQAGVQKDDER